MAVRFHLGEHVHTDIIAHSLTNGFSDHGPGRSSWSSFASPRAGRVLRIRPPSWRSLASHPSAKAFVEGPEETDPSPSFARQAYFASGNNLQVHEHRWTEPVRPDRLRPEAGTEFLTPEQAKQKTSSTSSPPRCRATPGGRWSSRASASGRGWGRGHQRLHNWPETRELVDFGAISPSPSVWTTGPRAAQDHLRPGPSCGRNRIGRRPADRGAFRPLPAERPASTR